MRITRGLFRLWIVTSILWIALVAVMTWQTWPVDDGTFTKPTFDPDAYLAGKPQFDPSKPFSVGKQTYANSDAFVAAERRDAVVKGTGIAFAPPLAAFILGMSLLWVVQGFRSEAS
jgi:hypothetical protein